MGEREVAHFQERRSWAGPLGIADFRALFLAGAFSGLGFWGELLVLSWYVLRESDSPLLVGLIVGTKIAPGLVVGIFGGALSDRIDRRVLLRMAALGLACNTAALSVLILVSAPLASLIILNLVGGALGMLSQTLRQSYAVDLVGQTDGLNGVAFVYVAQRIGAIAGAILAGSAVASLGAGEAYLLLSASYLLSFFAILFARSKGQAAPMASHGVKENIREFVQELRHNRTLTALVLLTAAVEVFGFSHITILPVLVRDVLHKGSESLGLVNAMAAVGGMVSSGLFSLFTTKRRSGLMFLAVLQVFGFSIISLGIAPDLATAVLAVLVVSAMAALSDVLSQGLIQLAVPNEMRGRASGAWLVAIGVSPIGHLQIGALASLFGAQTALLLNGALLGVVALATMLCVKRLRQL